MTSPDDVMLVEDFRLVRQQCTAISVEFDDDSVADFFDDQVDAGRKPERFGRIWLHTHPGNSPKPSMTDEETFRRCFGGADWAVMFILAHGGDSYARLRFNVGPCSSQRIAVEVDYTRPFAFTDFDAWREEYDCNVRLPSQRDDDLNGITSTTRVWNRLDQRTVEADWLERFDADFLFPEQEESRWLAAAD